jgi:hypothetical protein
MTSKNNQPKGKKTRQKISLDGLDPIATWRDPAGQFCEWRLYCYARSPGSPWRSLILLAPAKSIAPQELPRRKRYNVGWNGHRFARCTEINDLRERHPEMLKWLREVCPKIPSINDQERAA